MLLSAPLLPNSALLLDETIEELFADVSYDISFLLFDVFPLCAKTTTLKIMKTSIKTAAIV